MSKTEPGRTLADYQKEWNDLLWRTDPVDRDLVEKLIPVIVPSCREIHWALSPREVITKVGGPDKIKEIFLGNQSSSWCAQTAFDLEVKRTAFVYESQIRAMVQLWRNSGWIMITNRDIVWAVERFEEIHRDDQFRLHNENAAAVRYRDGWCVYAIHGIRVTKAVVERTYGFQDIMNESNLAVRSIMIRLYGAERMLKESGASLIDEGSDGALYKIPQKGLRRPLKIMKLVDHTPQVDGSFKIYYQFAHPDSTDFIDAKARAFGVSKDEYAPSLET